MAFERCQAINIVSKVLQLCVRRVNVYLFKFIKRNYKTISKSEVTKFICTRHCKTEKLQLVRKITLFCTNVLLQKCQWF